MERLIPANGEAMPKIRRAAIGITFAGSIAPVITATHPADALSFVRRRQESGYIDWWAVEDGSNFRADFAMGENMGREYLDFIGRYPTYGHCLLLGHIVAGMAHTIDERGRLGASATGFLRIVNEHAMASATILAMPEIDHA
ncbi:MAG: hypothetical protein BGO05_15965 [Rhizobiales bacterium 63-7]|nr:hypothetical protein [Hyphomicrobiales bacterium]OJU69536.1 MAG: hypothetical protein BGO05_15965 [Rhizobiales bacterium 63-7]